MELINLKEATMKKSLFALLLLLAACGKPAEPVALNGRNFTATAPNGTVVTIGFDQTENRAFGRVVNRFTASYEVEGDKIKFGPAAATMMIGLPEPMLAERKFHEFLEKVSSFSLKDDVLTLTASDGETMTFTATAAPAPSSKAPGGAVPVERK